MLLIGASMLWTVVIQRNRVCELRKKKKNRLNMPPWGMKIDENSENLSTSVFSYGKRKTQNAFSRMKVTGACIFRRRFHAVKNLPPSNPPPTKKK